jgi:DNA-directed RNA polymerase specialized sigma24 family protein
VEVSEQFRLFFDRHYRELGRLAHLMTDDAEAADGLAAAAFAAAWARWERVSAADSPTEYLWVLLMRQATMDDRDTGGRGPRDQAKRPEHRGVRQALALLPVRRRACVVLRYAFGLPEAEIARMVGISVAGVTSELSKGGAELERALGTPPGGAEPATGWFETGDGAPAGDAGSAERLRTSLSEEAARIEPSHDRILARMRVRVMIGPEPRRPWRTPLVTSVTSAVAVTAVIAAAVVFTNARSEPPVYHDTAQAAPIPLDPELTPDVQPPSDPLPASPTAPPPSGLPTGGPSSTPPSAIADASAPVPSPSRSRTGQATTPKPTPTRTKTGKTTAPKPTPTRSRTRRTTAPKPTPSKTRKSTAAPKPSSSRVTAAQQGVASLVPGAVVSLESVNLPGHRVRHRNFRGRLDPIGSFSTTLERADATFTVRQGLAGSSCVSLEASNFPGFYLRHRSFQIHLQRGDGSGSFAADATFCPTQGLAGQGISLRSHSNPTSYLRHSGGQLFLNDFQDFAGFRADSTFTVRPGL